MKLYVVLALVLSAACTASAQSSRSVTASLSVPWVSIPASPVMEASEIISDEKQGGDPHKFWSFLEQYGSTAPSPNSADAKEHEEAAVQASEGLLDKVARDVFALAINIRAGAPLVELHNSIAKTHLKGSGCGGSARVVVESKGFVCDPDKLVQTIFEDAPGDSAAAPRG